MDKRLDSLDALRGFDMFFITGGALLLTAIGTLITGNDNSWIAVQMTHASWTETLRIYDFIFPLFLFITGVTFPFVSAGGTSMLTSWAMLAYFKAADMRKDASLAIKRDPD